MYNPDERLFEVNYRNADNIAYLAARLEDTWGVERFATIMKAARVILDNQKEKK